MSELYRDFIDGKADEIINSLGGTITPAPANAELYRDFLDRKFDDVINGLINVLPIGSASGNPATFNTSLTLPLVACNTEFMCTQAGTGDPSPSNPRAITGVDSVAIQKSGYNIWNEQCVIGNISDVDGTDSFGSDRLRSVGYTSILPNHSYRTNVPFNSRLKIYYYDKQQTYLEYQSNKYSYQAFTTPANAYYMRFVVYPDYGTTYNNDISINADSTDTSYHPYISNTVTIIDLDGTRYGGYVDVVGKKLVVTHIKRKISECSWVNLAQSYGWFQTQITGVNDVRNDILTDYYTKVTTYAASQNTDMSIYKADSHRIFIHDNNYTYVTTWINAMGNYGFVVQLTTPIEISLSDIPTLSTLNGNNSFASDTGNIDIKYRCLPINLI